MQDRPKGCLLCNRTVSEVQEVCQTPVESSSIRVLLPLPRDFSSSSGFYKAIKSPYLSIEKAQYKNNNLPRRHATNGISLEDLLTARDIFTSTLRVSGQYQKVLPRANIDFRISWGDKRFCRNDFEPSQRETPQSTESLPGNPRKGGSNSQGTKKTDWEVMIHSNNSPSSTSPLLPSSTSPDSEVNLSQSQLFRKKVATSVEASKDLLWWKENLTLYNRRSLISLPTQIIISSDAS